MGQHGWGRRRREEELRLLIERHHDAIARYFRRRLPDDEVDGAVAEVFATAWRKLDRVPPGDGTAAWLYRVARNTLLHERRSVARRVRLSERLAAEPNPAATGDPAEIISASDRVVRAARHLSASDAELLELISWEQLQPRELAVVLGCSTNAATIRVHRMRKTLADLLNTIPNEERMTQ